MYRVVGGGSGSGGNTEIDLRRHWQHQSHFQFISFNSFIVRLAFLHSEVIENKNHMFN